jgi:hypothetical protein
LTGVKVEEEWLMEVEEAMEVKEGERQKHEATLGETS